MDGVIENVGAGTTTGTLGMALAEMDVKVEAGKLVKKLM
jgi:CTP synthase (UTP-ammonia lyase)